MGTILNIGIGIPFSVISGFPSLLSDGICQMRQEIRGDYFYTDKTLTALGFAGTENTDWEVADVENI